MEKEGQYLKNIKKGCKVEILTKQNKIVRGIVEDIGVGKEIDFRGIMVRLRTGEIGRVQKIIENKDKDREDIEGYLKKGENFNLEFKSSILWSIFYSEEQIRQSKSFDLHVFKQKTSKVVIAKSIAAFLNSEGGNLIIGIIEKKESNRAEVIGIGEDLKKLESIKKDFSRDGYRRMILDDVIRAFFPARIYNHLNDYINIDFIEYDNKLVCIIRIRRSDFRIFLKANDKEIFMIRTDSENRELQGEKLVDYVLKHWGR